MGLHWEVGIFTIYIAFLVIPTSMVPRLFPAACPESERVKVKTVSVKEWRPHDPKIIGRALLLPWMEKKLPSGVPPFKILGEKLVYFLDKNGGGNATFYSTSPAISNLSDLADLLEVLNVGFSSMVSPGNIFVKYGITDFSVHVVFEHFWDDNCNPRSLIRWTWRRRKGEI